MPLALITGPNRGLGEVLAQSFWEHGYSLLLVGRSPSTCEAMGKLPAYNGGQSLHFMSADFSDPSEVMTLCEQLERHTEPISVLVNNAAIQGPIGPAWTGTIADWVNTIQVNLLAPVALCRAVIPGMIARGSGSIINLSGGGATGPRANFSAYAAAKTGLVRFSETLADEAKVHGVKVNCVAPGAMKTAMLEQVLSTGEIASGTREFEIAKKVFLDGGASMDRVAQLALFLASRKSDGITGKLISAIWDDWENWPHNLRELASSDVYTLRRIVGRDRGFTWGDK